MTQRRNRWFSSRRGCRAEVAISRMISSTQPWVWLPSLLWINQQEFDRSQVSLHSSRMYLKIIFLIAHSSLHPLTQLPIGLLTFSWKRSLWAVWRATLKNPASLRWQLSSSAAPACQQSAGDDMRWQPGQLSVSKYFCSDSYGSYQFLHRLNKNKLSLQLLFQTAR